MPISHAHRALFVHIPKTGGTSIEVALGMFGDWRVESADTLFGQVSSPDWLAKDWKSRFLQHLSWMEISQIAPKVVQEEYLSFACVRNPWDRLVSVFSNKDPNLLVCARSRGLDMAGMDFEAFVDAACAFDHVHLRPQIEFVVDGAGRVAVQELLRFESLQADYECLRVRLGASAPLPTRNASHHGPYRQYYTAVSRDKVQRRYAADIEAFGYCF